MSRYKYEFKCEACGGTAQVRSHSPHTQYCTECHKRMTCTDLGVPRVVTVENKFDTDTDTYISFQCPAPTAGTQQTCAFCGAPIPFAEMCNCPGAQENRASLPCIDEPGDFPEAAPIPVSPEVQDVTGELYQCTNCDHTVRAAPVKGHYVCRWCGDPMHAAAHPTPTAPTHKTPFHLADLDFPAAMCDNYHAGIKDGRTANGWKNIKWTQETGRA